MNTLKNLFGMEKTDFAQLVQDGALILDVRSKGEFSSGHINGSINIALDQLGANLSKLNDKNRTIITCCASGMRSASATSFLKLNGYTSVYNGGGWQSLNQKIK